MPQSYLVPDGPVGIPIQLPPRNWHAEPWGEVIVRVSAPRGDVEADFLFTPPNPDLPHSPFELGGERREPDGSVRPFHGRFTEDAHKHTFVIEGSNYQPSTFWIRKSEGQEDRPLVVGIEIRPRPVE